MRYFVGLSLLMFLVSAQAAPVVIDFEDAYAGIFSGDVTSKGFTFDYLAGQGQETGIPIVSDSYSPNGTRGYINCPGCKNVEQIDVYSSSGSVFNLHSMEVAAIGSDGPLFDFTFTGYLAAGGTVSKSALNVSTLETLVFDSSWSHLDSFNISIESANGGAGFASFIDNVSVSAVPVPAAVWLFGSALAGLGWMRRKQVIRTT